MINLEWYRSFIAVYQSRTMTSAADILCLTQPAVSQHINALESVLGTKLFDRMPRKMAPTEEGRVLYTRVVESINILESTTNEYHQERTNPKSIIKIGTPNEFFFEKILGCLDVINCIYRISFVSSESLLEKLENGKIDVAITTKKESYNKRIEYKKIFTEDFVLVQSTKSGSSLKEFTDNNKEQPSEALLLQQNWISYDTELPIIRSYWRDAFRSRPAITPIVTIPNLHTIAKAVEIDKGVSILPSYICQNAIDAGRLEVVNASKNTVSSNDIFISYRKEDLKNKDIALFEEALFNKARGA